MTVRTRALRRLLAGVAGVGLLSSVMVISAAPAGAAPTRAARPAAPAPVTPAPTAVAGQPGFRSVVATRVLDTRHGLGAPAGPVGPGRSIDVQLTGVALIPDTGVAAVVFNLTAVAPTAGGFLTVYPTGGTRPNSSNLNFTAGQTTANEVIATVGTGGKVTIFNPAGNTHVLADVTGWFATDTYYHPLTPTRLLDTRTGQGTPTATPVGPGRTVNVQITGRAGIPATASAVAFTLTATHPTAGTFITAHPTGQPRPHTSNLNLTANQTTAVAVITKLGADGKITLYNDQGTVHLIADITGWFTTTGQFTPITPTRILDTRTITESPRGPGGTIGFDPAQVIPSDAAVAILSVTAVAPTGSGFLSVQPFDVVETPTSTLNYSAGHTTANLAITGLGSISEPTLIHVGGFGTVDIVVDLLGWFVAPLAITQSTLPDAALPGSYSRALSTTGGMAPVTWSVASGTLPAGLTLASTGPRTAAITGTPTTAGTSTFIVQAADSSGLVVTATYTLTVQPFVPGAVWAWGAGAHGELGNGSTPLFSGTPVRVSDLSGATQISGGDTSDAYALRQNGTVWAWGENASGALGDGTFTERNAPVRVTGLTAITAIAGGNRTGYALGSDGRVWSWGENAFGQLGDGGTTNRPVPGQVSGLTGVTAIAAGTETGYALKADGTVWAWGHHASGLLDNVPVTRSPVPVQVAGLTGVTAITAGLRTGYALKADGTVWAWGFNGVGQLGNGSTTDSSIPVQVSGLTGITAIQARAETALALRSDGTVWAWGFNGVGALGDGTTTNRSTPVRVFRLTRITAIARGGLTGYALGSDGTVWAWGPGRSGELGTSNSTFSLTPIRVAGMPPVTALSATGSTAYALGTS